MFTGIVTAIGTIESSEHRGDLRIRVACDFPTLEVGESIAVNGVCLTVTDQLDFTLSAETLARTAPRWQAGQKINLERALKMGDSLSGHLVTGHVDGVATIVDITPPPLGGRLGGGHDKAQAERLMPPPQPSPYGGGSHTFCLDAPAALSHFIAEKGSVTLDGVSLTVNRVEGARFWVNIIPHTWAATTFHDRKIGDALNLEVDMIARYIERLLKK